MISAEDPTSPLGQKQTKVPFGSKADIAIPLAHFCLVPNSGREYPSEHSQIVSNWRDAIEGCLFMSLNCARTTSKENGDMTSVGYARVSSTGQELDVQMGKLEMCERVFKEKCSGVDVDRPELRRCLDYVREGDTLVVTRSIGLLVRRLIFTGLFPLSLRRVLHLR